MKNKLPEKKRSLFIIKFDTTVPFNQKNILTTPDNTQVRITKIYKYNLYRKILRFFGFRFKLFNCVKVKPQNNE